MYIFRSRNVVFQLGLGIQKHGRLMIYLSLMQRVTMNTQFAAGFDTGRGTYVFVETGGDVYHFTVEDIRKGVAQGNDVVLSSGGSESSRAYDSQLNTSFVSADGEDFIDQLLALYVAPTMPVSINAADITGSIPVTVSVLPDTSVLLNTFLRDGANENANGNYLLSQTVFSYAPAVNEVATVTRIIGYISGPGFDDDQYGDIILVNGVKFEVEQDSATMDLLDTETVFTWQQWREFCYDVDDRFSNGNDHAGFRWTFTQGTSSGIQLDGSTGDEIRIILEDDFTPLVRHTFIIQGSITTSS